MHICDKSECTGCSACKNICPKGCITMIPNDTLRHVYPSINDDICIQCGLCVKVCPANHTPHRFTSRISYAGWNKNVNEYKSCSSGGAATAICRTILEKGGIVYGCAQFPGIEIKHIRVDSPDQLYLLKESKYAQSIIDDTYRNILTDLNSGKRVLFIGTPCQVAGLKNYIGKRDTNLYTIDLVCHGVPSQGYLKQHVKSIVGSLNNVIIRFRENNAYVFSIKIKDDNGTKKTIYRNAIFEKRYQDGYLNSFFDGYSFRDSCYNCKFANIKRCSDLTLGDFWGIGKEIPFEHEHKYGCSLLLPNTDKGAYLIENIKDQFYLYERSVEEAIKGNSQLRHPVSINRRKKFFRKLTRFLSINIAYHISVADLPLRHRLFRLKTKLLNHVQ